MQYQTSPEEVPAHWHCLSCGNRSDFIGVDDNGYGGDTDEHDDECPIAMGVDGEPCTCTAVLAQGLRVEGGDVVYYDRHEGGGGGAEIGMYTRIYCGTCDACLWAADPSKIDEPYPV
jgi:hypothetical protein